MALSIPMVSIEASADAPADPLHGGTGVGVTVLGHSDLGGEGLNGHVAVLGNTAYVGMGTNGGFAAQWNKTPTCRSGQGAPTSAERRNKVKVVDLGNDGTNPTVVSTIHIGNPLLGPLGDRPADLSQTLVRDVAAIKVEAITPEQIAGTAFTGKLLAVAKEACDQSFLTEGETGVEFYNVNNPALPVLLGKDNRNTATRVVGATRQVSLVQKPDGRVYALEANQQGRAGGGGIHMVDITNPTAPSTVGRNPVATTNSRPLQECRPFAFAQGATFNATGTKAYGAFQDGGLVVMDTSNPPGGSQDFPGDLPLLSQTKYPQVEEGNSFRFVPQENETKAVATDEDLNPAKTRLTITNGTFSSTFVEPEEAPGTGVPGVFRGCEAIWGAPQYRNATTSLVNKEIAFVPAGGCRASAYAGLDIAGKLVLTQRGGADANNRICSFQLKAQFAQDPNQDGDKSDGGVAVLVQNTATDHHGGGSSFLFSGDSNSGVDAGVTIPLVNITREAGVAIQDDIFAGETVTATLADSAQTWGALRIFTMSGATPTQTAVFNAPGTNVLTPGQGLYHAVNPVWKGNQVYTAWMSDGFRMVDAQNPSTPQGRSFYVPPAVADPTGNYPTVPLVVDVEKWKKGAVITDVNGGLYVLEVAHTKDECSQQAHGVTACQARFDAFTAGTTPAWTTGSPAGTGDDPDTTTTE